MLWLSDLVCEVDQKIILFVGAFSAAAIASNSYLTGRAGVPNPAGIEVIACESRGRSLAENKHSSAAADHDLAIELGRKVLRGAPDAQALLMPGGLWFAIHAVPLLEAEFGKPVLLNILSTTWAALHAAKNVPHRPDPKWGKVLQNF